MSTIPVTIQPPPGGVGHVPEVLALLAATDPGVCDRAGLDELVSGAQRVRCWLDAFDIRIAQRARELAALGQSESAGSVLANGGRRSQRNSEQAAERARVCTAMPAVQNALEDGRLSAEHVDALVAASATLNDAQRGDLADRSERLIDLGSKQPVEVFERECRSVARRLSRDEGRSRHAENRHARRVRRWVDNQTGMCKTLLELDSETDATVWTAIHAAVAAARSEAQHGTVSWDHLRVDAVVALITGARAVDRRVPELSVLIDVETLRSGLHARSTCETSGGQPLPPDVIRKLACDADIVPVVLGGDGEVLDVGRSSRLATRAQRRALRAMYSTCGYPRCSVAFDHCRIHHVTPWELGGRTDLDTLIPLCTAHHHLVHEGGWTLTLCPDRTVTVRRPDGTIHFRGRTTTAAHPTRDTAA